MTNFYGGFSSLLVDRTVESRQEASAKERWGVGSVNGLMAGLQWVLWEPARPMHVWVKDATAPPKIAPFKL